MKTVVINNNAYIESVKDVNDKDPKLKVGIHVRISKYKNIFAKGCNSNWSEEVKNIVPWTYVINDLNGKIIIGKFYKKQLQKRISKYLGQKKSLKKGNKLYVKWKGYDNSCKSWSDKKELIE